MSHFHFPLESLPYHNVILKNRDETGEDSRRGAATVFLYGLPAVSNRPVALVSVHVSRLDTIIPTMFPLLPYLILIHPGAYQPNHDFQMRMAREPI